jgi:hypothetical protein
MTPSDRIRTMFATFDAQDVPGLARLMTDDVRLRLGNADPVQGKSACNVFRLRAGLVAEYRSYIDATPVYA